MADLTENYQLKWHSFGSHLHSCVTASLHKETFTDVFLHTMDGHQISAHRFVLSASSQYLHEILKKQQRINANLPLLIILPPEINYRTMKTLIQYMYSGETTISKDILENVLRGGDLLKVKGLWRPEEERQQEKQLPEKDTLKFISHSKTPKIKLLDYKHNKNITINSNKKETVKTSTTTSPINQANAKMTKVNQEESQQTPENTNANLLLQSNQENAQEYTTNDAIVENASSSNDNLQFLVIKEEPIEWSELENSEMEMIDESEMFQDEMTIKPEVILDDSNDNSEELYSPLTCELCSETFTLPAEWVRHIQTHTDMLPAKRQRRGKSTEDENAATFPPLKCDMCHQHFPTPAEWVRHIQNAHTEFELRISNKSSLMKPIRISRHFGTSHKICGICSKKFPSHASMLIHKRTHTGEKPYMCEHCQKGFNVKSNLLRHLRTLHDRIINSDEIRSKEGAGSGNSNT